MKKTVNRLKFFVSILLISASIILGIRLIINSVKNQQYRIDLSEINSIRYGLLNADEWKESLANIITKKIGEFELTEDNQENLKEQVENLLYRLLDEVDAIMKNDMGKIKRFLANTFVDMEKLRESIPELADTLLEEMSKPENKESIKEYILFKLDSFVSDTFNKDERVKLNAILKKYDSTDKQFASAKLASLSNEMDNKLRIDTILILILLGIVFALNSIKIGRVTTVNSSLLLMVTTILLVCGIAMPMIDIEAKISMLNFQLMGENIVFYNQVLFFQSKSILDVVWILIITAKIEMIFVGLLILCFSVLFPFTKVICTFITIHFPKRTGASRFIRFFTFKSGKWSMADVFVVAIFMAFIGFSGIISDQLSHLSNASDSLEILTTNGTNLQAGFYLFLMFCLSGLFMSELLHKKTPNS